MRPLPGDRRLVAINRQAGGTIIYPVVEQVEPDRAVIRDDDREMCRICGELPANSTTFPGRCKRCERAIEDERDRGY